MMRTCPNCHKVAVSRVRLFFQELSIPGVICCCQSCNEWVSIVSERSSNWVLAEFLFLVCLTVSLIYFTHAWYGVVAFILLRVLRVYVKSGGPLELPNETM